MYQEPPSKFAAVRLRIGEPDAQSVGVRIASITSMYSSSRLLAHRA